MLLKLHIASCQTKNRAVNMIGLSEFLNQQFQFLFCMKRLPSTKKKSKKFKSRIHFHSSGLLQPHLFYIGNYILLQKVKLYFKAF